MKKSKKILGSAALALAGAAVGVGAGLYASRLRTLSTIKKLTDSGTPYDLYSMEVKFPYDLGRMIDRGLGSDQEIMDAITHEAMPLFPFSIKAPDFGCSAFTLTDERDALMGRNYDFRFDTSAMLVHCAPDDGYRSIAFCALDNLGANDPLAGIKNRFACLAAPFACLDGVNEKGVSIAVLTLDSEPVHQNTGKSVISTSIAIRLVLDHASTTQEAVDLMLCYDMFASFGRDYHFYITDASGDGRVVEYDCDSQNRKPVVTKIRQVTNFFAMYLDRVEPNQKNGQYGHGRERYDAIEKILDNAEPGGDNYQAAWEALRAAAQEPKPGDITSNTQWSIVFNNRECTADIALHRRWNEVYHAAIDKKD